MTYLTSLVTGELKYGSPASEVQRVVLVTLLLSNPPNKQLSL